MPNALVLPKDYEMFYVESFDEKFHMLYSLFSYV